MLNEIRRHVRVNRTSVTSRSLDVHRGHILTCSPPSRTRVHFLPTYARAYISTVLCHCLLNTGEVKLLENPEGFKDGELFGRVAKATARRVDKHTRHIPDGLLDGPSNFFLRL